MRLVGPTTAGILDHSAANPSAGNAKIANAAQEFESVLVGQWMKDAEESFGSVPGGDGDEDSSKDQIASFGVQSLARDFVKHGGIGIASMVQRSLAANAAKQDASVRSRESQGAGVAQ